MPIVTQGLDVINPADSINDNVDLIYSSVDSRLINGRPLVVLNNPGESKILNIDVSNLNLQNNQIDTIELVVLDEYSDIEKLQYTLSFAYSSDELNWSIFYTDFNVFKQLVNTMAIGTSVIPFIRVLIQTHRLENPKQDTQTASVLRRLVISSFKINGEISNNIHVLEIIDSYSVNRQIGSNLFNPYFGMEKMQALKDNISIGINNFAGFWVYYWRTEPDQETKSATFKQYRLKNTTSLKKIKVSLPGNKIPSSRNIFSEWNIQFADDFIIHVLHSSFETAFGEGKRPHEGDYLYFPLTKRMYTVNTGYERKDFMYNSTFTECPLIKYEQKENIKDLPLSDFEIDEYADDNLQGKDTTSQLLEYIEFVSNGGVDIFEKQELNEAVPEYMDLRRFEAHRKFLHNNIQFANFGVNLQGLQVFESSYLLDAIPSTEKSIVYTLEDSTFENFCLSFWGFFTNGEKSRDIVAFINNSNEKMIKLSFSNLGNNKLIFSIGNQSLSYSIELSKMYHISINISNEFGNCSLLIYEFDTETKNIVKKFYDFIIISPLNEFKDLEFYGGKQILGWIRAENVLTDDINAINRIMRSKTDQKETFFSDKSTPPLVEAKFNLNPDQTVIPGMHQTELVITNPPAEIPPIKETDSTNQWNDETWDAIEW